MKHKTMAQKKVMKKMSTNTKVGIGLGLTAAAVTAAGAYFLYGSKQAPQNRKKVKGWVLKAKGEVLEALGVRCSR
jgi:flagellar basal body-associated protein FliL